MASLCEQRKEESEEEGSENCGLSAYGIWYVNMMVFVCFQTLMPTCISAFSVDFIRC